MSAQLLTSAKCPSALHSEPRWLVMSVGELCSELKDLSAFVIARDKLPGDEAAKAAVSKNVVDSFVQRISCVKVFNSQVGLQLCKTLVECELNDELRIAIQTAIDSRVGGTVAAIQHARHGNMHYPQKLTSQICNYFTAEEQALLRGDRTSVAGRMQVVIDRFRRIGLQSPHEQTVKWAVALAALAIAESCGSYPTYSSVFAMVHDFKATLDSSRTNWPFGHMVDFPITATELPADVFRHAYDEDNPPVPFMWDRLAATAEHHVPLRKSSNLLKRDGASSSGPHMAQSAAQNQTVTWDQLRDLLQGRGGFQQGSSSLGHQAVKARMLGDVSPETPRTPHEADGLSSFQPHGRRFSALALPDRDREDVASPGPRVQEPLPAVPERQLVLRTAPALADTAPLAAAAASGAGGVGSAPATPKAIATPPETTRATTAEEYEARALAALVDRKEKKAIAKKAEAKKAGAKKRPAAAEESSADEPPAAPAAKKRPAAAVEPPSALDEAVIIFECTAEDKKHPRRNFQSKAYHATATNAAKLGYTDADVRACAQQSHKHAGEIYDAS